MPKFDIVLAQGLIHHLDKTEAEDLINLSYAALTDGGRFISLDGCYEKGQNPIVKLILKLDRGKNVRTQVEYESLFAKTPFSEKRFTIKHRSWIPYTYIYAEATK